MPNGHQGHRTGRQDQRLDERNQRNQRTPQYRGELQQDQRTAGGRSEQLGRQRDGEQMRAGYDQQDWERQRPVRNVRSEPHWDPSAGRGTWDPAGAHAGTHAEWSDEDFGSPQYGGSPSYEGASYGPRPAYDYGEHTERGFGGRGREWQDESRYRAQGEARGFGSRESYNRDVGSYGRGGEFRGDRGFDRFYGERGASGQGFYGSRHEIREGGSYGGRDYHEPQHEESLGQQLGDAGRRIIGKVKRLVRNPKNYTRSDERIREDVCDRLALSAEVDPSEVEVTVSNGEVTLAGTVQNRQMKFQAEEIADDVAGVHDVHNQLRVRREQPANSNAQNTSSDPQRARTVGRS